MHERTQAPLESLDGMLAEGLPFGDSGYISGQMQIAYQRRLRKISASLPVAGDLLEALDQTDAYNRYRIYGDPVVRCGIQHAMRQIATGAPYGLPLTDCAAIFGETLRHLELGRSGGPLGYGDSPLDRLGPSEYHGCIWSDDGADRVFARSFRYLVQNNFGDPVGSPNKAALDALRRGAQLLEDVLPCVTRSALSHAHVIALFPSTGQWTNRASCSQYRLVGTVFLKRKSINDPWWVAEHLLHECLHQKLYDIRHGHSLLARDSAHSDEEAATGASRNIVSIWNIADQSFSNHWGISRSMVAFHVYAHLALFGLLADERAVELEMSYGPRSTALTDSRSAFERALYLGSAIRESCWQELGPAGECLIDWLTQFLDALAPAPPRDIVYVDLMIQRYKREAKKAESLQSMFESDATGARGAKAELHALIVEELAAARRILATVHADMAPLSQLGDEISSVENGLEVFEFSRARGLIARALSDGMLWPDSATVGFNSTLREQAEGMIDRSSERLRTIFSQGEPANIPGRSSEIDREPRAPGWDERAELLNLTDVFGEGYGTEEFCLFLYTIVRMHAPKVIVELGTGHGASAFWMALGAKRNGRGHVWTVDDQEHIGDISAVLKKNMSQLKSTLWRGLDGLTPDTALAEVSRLLRLDDYLTLIHRKMRPAIKGHFDDYPFAEPIDLLFSDFNHGPTAILQILGHFLPRMSSSCSIFIDSASTSWPSYLLLERLVDQLNDGQISALLQEYSAVDLAPLIRDRRVTLVHLTEWRRRNQNSTAWLKFEPVDLQPYPRTLVRGLP